jgi:chemotaxis protein histidine kinase CheA
LKFYQKNKRRKIGPPSEFNTNNLLLEIYTSLLMNWKTLNIQNPPILLFIAHFYLKHKRLKHLVKEIHTFGMKLVDCFSFFSFKTLRNVTDESSMLFIELFMKNENKFIGVISLSMRKFLKETMIDSYYPLIDELGSEISNLRLHLSIQYSRIKKEEIEQEEQKNKKEEMKRNEEVKKQDVVESVKMNQDPSLNANPTTQEESKNVDPVVVEDTVEVSPVLTSVDGLMLQEKRLHQIESDIIENQEELNKLKQLQFSTLSQLGSSKLDTKLHTMESQFDELNGVREIIMLNTF